MNLRKRAIRQLTFALLASAAAWHPFQSAFAATPGDYDGDGKADLALVDEDANEDKTTVFVRKSSTGSVIAFTFFPFGDYVVSGRFYGGDKTYPAIVHEPSTAGAPLMWYFKTPSGAQTSFAYGVLGDTPLTGDFDCDGFTDIAVTRNGTADFYPGFKLWYAFPSSAPGLVQQQLFGLATDRFAVIDADGQGCENDMVALRGDFNYYIKGFYDTDINPVAVQWGLPTDKFVFPYLKNGVLTFGVSRPSGSSSFFYERTVSGSDVTATITTAGSANAIPLVGNFFGGNTPAWYERVKRGSFGIRRLDGTAASVTFGNQNRGVLRPDASYVPEGQFSNF